MIEAVLDTNVLASGLAGFRQPTSTPGQLLRHWQDGRFDLILSEFILTELAHTLQQPYFQRRLSSQMLAGLSTLLRSQARIVPITARVQGVATHPEDDRVLATAVSAGANYLVTGDKKLQQLQTFEGVAILSPRSFLDML
jgi:uncharacterized protein